ncbi:MAG: MurR/RpiR family transcriptional regulator [Anaerolineaceae bacterium]|nr:MurR/RpiR family transcriptional regulator [Anaerolineaceae bacterium]
MNNRETDLDFSQLISDKFNDLTKSEKRIANYLRKNQEESAFLSASELSNRLNLSEATMVRFARSLGFNSYPAMRNVLQDAFRRRVTHSARLRSRLDDLREAGDIFEQVTVSEIDYLTQALQTVDRSALHQAVSYFIEHERIFIFGTGPSTPLVDLLNIRLTRFGKHVIPLTATGRETLEPLLLMTDRDLLFAIGFFDVNPTLQTVLDHAGEVGCTTILLTDTLGSIIGDKASVILAAKRGPVSAFHSIVVPMTIINTLLLEIANENQDVVIPNLDTLTQLREHLKRAGGS